jgi:GxxExxY protein
MGGKGMKFHFRNPLPPIPLPFQYQPCMPIQPSLHLDDLTQDAFDSLDQVVMRHAYAVQNQFGRLFDERIYENELARRLRKDGFEVHTQVPVRVGHASFEKTYFLDLVVNQMVYELKVVTALTAEHHAQALHYAMLNNIRRVKLLNFRSPKVVGNLLYNPLSDADRHRSSFLTNAFKPLTPHCERLLTHVRSLISDWGTHLSSRLYNEALVHHFGGETECQARVQVGDADDGLGTHLIQAHAPGCSFVVTGVTRHIREHQKHLQCLLNNLDLLAMQWINLNHSEVELTTLSK